MSVNVKVKGVALLHVMLVLSLTLLLSVFLYSQNSSQKDHAKAGLTAHRVSFLLEGAYTFFKRNGWRWPYDSVNRICLGGNKIPVGAVGNVSDLSTGWGDTYSFDCDPADSDYVVIYDVPVEWMSYMIRSIPLTELVGVVEGIATLKSSVDRDAELTIVGPEPFGKRGGDVVARFNRVCQNPNEAKWLHSVTRVCGTPRADEGEEHGDTLVWVSRIVGWKVDEYRVGNKREFSLLSYRYELRADRIYILGFPTLLFGFPYSHYSWITADETCNGVVPEVTAVVKC